MEFIEMEFEHLVVRMDNFIAHLEECCPLYAITSLCVLSSIRNYQEEGVHASMGWKW